MLKYPIGIQSFEEIRTEGYLYIDKTDLIHKLISEGKYYFLSRPRRFGKSLLLSTIEAYYRGRRDLFKGLAIDSLTDEWEPYPVLHIDLNTSKYDTPEELHYIIDDMLKAWEEQYSISEPAPTFALRFGHIIENAHRITGKKVVILIDEYDKPLTESILDMELSESFRNELRAVYSNLKSKDRHIEFAMLTGVTRFSRMTIFSGLNNLLDITMSEDFEAICGITEREMRESFTTGITGIAERYSITYEEALDRLREWYDGYQFSDEHLDVYNPYSLLCALKTRKLTQHWFSTGTPRLLARLLSDNSYRLRALQAVEMNQTLISQEDAFMTSPVALLLQTGYLTIKGWNADTNEYRLGYPNREVKEGFLNYMYRYYIERSGAGIQNMEDFSAARFRDDVIKGDPEEFMRRLEALMATLNLDPRGNMEAHYQNAVYLVFTLMGFMAGLEIHSARGRSDMVVVTERFVYIFEFKTDGTAQEAIDQIEQRGYAVPWLASGKTIFRIGVNFDTRARSLTPWIIR